ncbi:MULTISPECIES: hypothetical protein [Burkholderia cepacia complex]|uniref:hypothetical protein n=1 Tax=Burkholderia cenocepacia TaxID=95486 RepID=UPI0022374E9D|nr:hypothetical protein [Burkholderia cenocepacia]MCW5156418.1 hypothetical protein [Burkholderia cenocepacia]
MNIDTTLKDIDAIIAERNSWKKQKPQQYVNPYKQTLEEFVAKPIREVHFLDLMTGQEQQEKLSVLMTGSIGEQKDFVKKNDLREFGVDPDNAEVKAWKQMREDNNLSFQVQPGQLLVHDKQWQVISTVRGNDPQAMIQESLQSLQGIYKKTKAQALSEDIEQDDKQTVEATSKKGKGLGR